ncbi:hypothetical protein OEZ85_000200 [Tetradesmus obliquus]|uniref:Uncharacterized protein n=1 Tax=Tetradesmus obliquus TaxID=3088 RepID=A0ABY8UV91_TETOB|nr:hypothetical protein OEZ85_000200 [Tetradesmus obliquus]
MLHSHSLSSSLLGRPAPRSSSSSSHVAASMGGRGRGGWSGSNDNGLILGPNGGGMGRSGGPQGPPGRLIIPGGPGQSFGGQGGPGRGGPGPGGRSNLEIDDSVPSSGPGQLPQPNKYRPPPGFMNEAAQDPAFAQQDPQDMLGRLRARAGPWHSLAKLLPVLYAKGFDTSTVAELTGVNPVDQNLWVVAGTVYDSIVSTGKVAPQVLSFFDFNGEELLYHFRFLPAERRAAAAQYIATNTLDAPACEALARAMKEWERRPGERTGFSDSPGDCLAFKYLRDAVECRFAEEAAQKLATAFQAADTEGAAARLSEWRENELAAAEAATTSFASKAVLQVLRLQQDELGFRPLPQVSHLPQLSVEELQGAPTTSQEGAFGTFNMPATSRDQKWVALPQWKALSLARHPVAIPLINCAAEPSVLAASRAKTEEEKKRLTGAGLLVVDTIVPGPLDPNAFYLVKQHNEQRLALAEGAKLAGEGGAAAVAPLAAVLFLCRPPNRESTITSSELLQL